jgi:amino acid transporter/nucleotide-binding universal stress UspA family protein
MLYGDWGTSRFYVLGLAFYFALYSSFWYILGVGILVAAVGWAYTVVCRVYPDGGGVYSAARQISPLLSVVGALLLFADYAVTAALSAYEGMHYFGFDQNHWVKLGACLSVVILGVVNYIGPRRAGTFALIVAGATLVLTLILVGFSIPYLGEGWRSIQPMHGSPKHQWFTLVNVVLALSGVEAIANMTGIMVQPVGRTSKKSIWPVLIEVVGFNILLGIAMLALPATMRAKGLATEAEFRQPAAAYVEADERIAHYRDSHPDWDKPAGAEAYEAEANAAVAQARAEGRPAGFSSKNEDAVKNKVLRVMGEVYVRPWFGAICGIVFGLLLLSAVNTVIGGMMSVSYVMARDKEVPKFFNKLNTFGVPWVGLIPAVAVPVLLLLLFPSLEMLADLYAIGVVGAIAINLTCCTINAKLPVAVWERLCIGAIAAVMIAIELTLAVRKPHALIFAGIILGVGLGARFVTKSYLPARARKGARPTTAEELARVGGAEVVTGPAVEVTELGTPAEQLDMSKPKVLVATRGGQALIDFATKYTKRLDGLMMVMFVRQINVISMGKAPMMSIEEDDEARGVFRRAAEVCKKAGVPMVPIYVVSPDVAYAILDHAATYSVESVLMGVSRQASFLRALRGDVLAAVADHLPADIPLLIHA